MRIRSKSKKLILSIPILVALALFSISTFSLVTTEKKASALSAAANFKAGNIIDDAVFYNKDTMNAQQIQDFLNRLLPNCDTWGTRASGYGNLTNAQYAQQIKGWHGPPYVCLNNYYENPTTGETSFEKGGGSFAGGVSAANIIYNAAQTYGINPQVLLVLLKKESAGPLTADSWPLKNQYTYAMGYGCPDSGPGNSANCNTQRAGFYKQMTTAAWQLKYYKDNSNSYRYKIGWNDIQYSPTVSCGTKRVNIENVATLSLYIYTPYTPNDGALNNYPGEAPCGAYGNRNFFMFFTEWFGTTRGDRWSPLLDPRVMVSSKNTNKINPDTRASVQTIPAGTQIKFPTKTSLSDQSGCLRTQFDTDHGVNACIPHADLGDFTPTIENISPDRQPVIMKTTQWTCKVNYRSVEAVDQCFDASTLITFTQKTTVAGVDYFITKMDSEQHNTTGFRADRIAEVPVESALAEEDKRQKSIIWTCKVDLATKAAVYDQCYDKDTVVNLSKRITINNIEYLVTKHDAERSINSAFIAQRFVRAPAS